MLLVKFFARSYGQAPARCTVVMAEGGSVEAITPSLLIASFQRTNLINHFQKLFERQRRQRTDLVTAVHRGEYASAKEVLNRFLIWDFNNRDEIILAQGGVEVDDPITGLSEEDLGLLVNCPSL